MNMAQAIELIDGKYQWRCDTGPGFSVLLLELSRMPVFRMFSVTHIPTVGYRKRHAMSPIERQEIAARQIEVLRTACEERLSFAEICARAGCEFNQTTRQILQEHIDARSVETCGRGRAARYWARKGR